MPPPPSGEGGTVQDAYEFILQNFAETNRLWVRMQNQVGTTTTQEEEEEAEDGGRERGKRADGGEVRSLQARGRQTGGEGGREGGLPGGRPRGERSSVGQGAFREAGKEGESYQRVLC